MAHYFGDSARDVFFGQYHHLARHRLIEGNASNKLSKRARLESDKAKRDTGAGSISRVALQPKSTYEVDFPFAPKRPNTAGVAVQANQPQPGSIASAFGNQSSFLFDEGHNSLLASLDGPSASILTSFYDPKTKLNDNEPEPSSPRTTYLEGCLNEGLKPRASLILRKQVTTEINLKHNLMGDKMAVVFAKALKDLPLINSLNICDNALTDEFVTAILDALLHLPNITNLDISNNKIDGNASSALADYLKSKSCPLKILTLSGADIDDGECDRFISSLRQNTTIKELDMSNNKIGISEPLNTVKPDFRTGAEALAAFLMKVDCPLEVLKLQWNMIRLDGSVTFANSLRLNTSITDLDISYNSLGRHGGEALGDALVENKTLKTLNICGNSLNATACFTICVGIEENFVLRSVILDNNAIGTEGAKALLELPSTVGNRVRVSAERCNCKLVDHDFKFNRNDPGGIHDLHLDNPFERAVAFKILQIIAQNTSYKVTARYDSPAALMQRNATPNSKKGKGEIKLVRGYSDHKVKLMDREQRELMSRLKRVARAALDMDAAVALFNEFDEDGSGSIDHDELSKLLEKLGVDVDEKVVSNAMATYDLDGEGSLEMAEFLQFLMAQHDEAISRLREMAECPIMCLASKLGERYVPPRRGVLHLTVTDSFQTSESQRVLSSFDYNNILKLIKSSRLDLTESFTMALKNVKLRQAEALKIYAHLHNESRDKVKALGVLLPLMLDAKEARAIVEEIIGDDDIEMNKLKTLIGSAIKPILGFYDGYYDLDLARETDRVCVLQLLNRSQDVVEKRKKLYEDTFGNGMMGDCSQKQNWSAFRNELFNGSDAIITPSLFTPVPTSGKLSFDFLASDHPPKTVTALSDKRCISCLISLGLMTESDRSRAQDALNTWREYGTTTSDGLGKELPIADYARAYSIQQFSNKFRTSLKERTQQLIKAIKREDVYAFRLRQAQLAAKRKKYTSRQRSGTVGLAGIRQRKASAKDRKATLSASKAKVLSRTGADAGLLAASIKEFQELAIEDLGQGDEEQESEDSSSGEEDYEEGADTPVTNASKVSDGTAGAGGNRNKLPMLSPVLSRKRSNARMDSIDEHGGSFSARQSARSSVANSGANSRATSPPSTGRLSMSATPRTSDMPKRVNTYVVEDTEDDDLMDLALFTPKQTTKANVKPGNKFSFDFLDEKPAVTDVTNVGDILLSGEISKMNTFDSLGSDEEGEDEDEENVTGGLISGLEELSKLNLRPRGNRGSDSNTPSITPRGTDKRLSNAFSMGDKRQSSAKLLTGQSQSNLLKDAGIEEKTDRGGIITRRTSSLSIAMDYLAENMHQVALAARKNNKSDLSMSIRANGIVIAVEKIFSKVWMSARHLALILSYFAIGKEKKTSNFGTYRVEIFVTLFCRIVDPQNIDSAIKILTPYEAACVYCRVGWLNIFNPLKPDGAHVMDLSLPDERCVIKQLALLSSVEPGENIRASRFRWKWEDDDLAGWVLLAPWVSEEQMPHRGVMYLDYYSGEGEGLRSCAANVMCRRSMLSLVYAGVSAEDTAINAPDDADNDGADEAGSNAGSPRRAARSLRFAQMHMDLWKKLFFPKRLMGTRGVKMNDGDGASKEAVAPPK